MQNVIMEKVNTSQLNPDLPLVKTGWTVKITWIISAPGEKERLQVFQGIILSIKGSTSNRNILVRKGIKGKGVEKTFPIHSPLIKNIEVVSEGIIKRAKPYYLRNLSAKAIRNKIKTNKNTQNK